MAETDPEVPEENEVPAGSEVPEGAAVFPLIPPELGAHPLLLAVLHSVVFLSGSDDALVNPAAAEEALQYISNYLQRLQGDDRRRVQEDLSALAAYARHEKWPKQLIQFLKTFLADYGVAESE
jgi:hypothetical protein